MNDTVTLSWDDWCIIRGAMQHTTNVKIAGAARRLDRALGLTKPVQHPKGYPTGRYIADGHGCVVKEV